MMPGKISGFTQLVPLQKIFRPLISNCMGGTLRVLGNTEGSFHAPVFITNLTLRNPTFEA